MKKIDFVRQYAVTGDDKDFWLDIVYKSGRVRTEHMCDAPRSAIQFMNEHFDDRKVQSGTFGTEIIYG